MNRTKLHALNPETARKRIKAATSTKAFMTALMERDHRRHAEAVRQWTRLHEAVHPETSFGENRAIGPGRAAWHSDVPSTAEPGRSHGQSQSTDPGIDERPTRETRTSRNRRS